MQISIYNAEEEASLLQDYFFFREKLLRVHEEKDLGVVISDKRTWDSHLHLTTAKASKRLGLPAKEIMCLVN